MHPSLLRRRMTCRKINRITLSDHETFLVEYARHVYEDSETGEPIGPPVAVLDCAELFDIEIYYEPKMSAEDCRQLDIPFDDSPPTVQGMIFGFVMYFTAAERAELHAAFERGEYDYLGDLPEF